MTHECIETMVDTLVGDSYELYKTIFENSAVAITVTDAQERLIHWNRYAEKLLGLTKEELYLKPIQTLYPPEEWQKIRSQNIRQKGMQHHLETKILRKNNEPLDIALSLSVLKNKEGTIIGSIGIIKDISEQKKAEAKVAFEHHLLQSLLDNIPDSIYFKDEHKRFILVNKAKAAHSHVTPEEMIGKTDFHFLQPLEAEKASYDDTQVMLTGEPIINKIEHIKRSDGSEHWISVTKIPRYNEQRQIIGTMGISRDITAQKQAEQKLILEHSLFQSLLDNIPDSIYFKDENNRFILVNKAKAEHSQVKPEEMIGKTDFDFLAEHQARKAFEDDQKILQTGQPIIAETEKIVGKDGSERWVSVTKIPRYSPDGKIIGTMGISRDITKQIKGNKETEKYKKVAIGQNLRMIELRDKVKELISELEKEQ
ncbi:MAG: PAS domain-containing protein [Candidatus Thermoplasmatota archaeon]